MYPKHLLFLPTIFLLFIAHLRLSAQQSNWSLQANVGYSQFETIDDFREELRTVNGEESGFSRTNITEPARSFQIGLGVNYELHTRWTVSLFSSYSAWQGELGKDRLLIINPGEPNELSFNPRSDRELYVAQAQLLLFHQFLPDSPFRLSVGLGPALAHRQHYYESYAQLDYVPDFAINKLESTYSWVKRTDFGMAASIRMTHPLSARTRLGLQADAALFHSEDHQRSISLLLAYQL